MPLKKIHAHLVAVLSTSILMWAYTILAFLTINSSIPWLVMSFASVIHLASPLLYRFNNNGDFDTDVFLFAGIIHQTTFSYYSGGYDSSAIVWFVISPLLAGIIYGIKGIKKWTIISIIAIFIFLLLELLKLTPPLMISRSGLIISKTLLIYGWIGVNLVTFSMYISQNQKSKDKIKEKKGAIENLLNSITHDIGVPLVTISLRNEMEWSLQNASKISSSIQSIRDVINNVQKMYEIELSGDLILREDINLKQSIIKLKELYSDKMESKQIGLIITLDDSVEYILNINEEILIHHILGNILSNAIKFSFKGSEIILKLYKDKGYILISIKDSGIGMSDEIAASLLSRNAKLSRRGTNDEPGTGYGLSIAKTYIEKFNGTIEVESVPYELGADHGTTFVIKF